MKYILSLLLVFCLSGNVYSQHKKAASAGGTVYPTQGAPATGDSFFFYDASLGATTNFYYEDLVEQLDTLYSGGSALAPTDLAGSTTLTVNKWYYDTLSLNRTMDDIDLIGVDGDKIIITFDVTGTTRSINFHDNSTVYRIGEVNPLTAVVNFPVGNHELKLSKIDGKWWLTDSGIITETARAFSFAISDEITALTVGTKLTWRAPFACTISAVYAELTSSSSSGIPTFDINKNGSSILSTALTVDVSETDSADAAVPVVISNPTLAARDRLTFDIDIAGTGATGAKITIVYTQP